MSYFQVNESHEYIGVGRMANTPLTPHCQCPVPRHGYQGTEGAPRVVQSEPVGPLFVWGTTKKEAKMDSGITGRELDEMKDLAHKKLLDDLADDLKEAPEESYAIEDRHTLRGFLERKYKWSRHP